MQHSGGFTDADIGIRPSARLRPMRRILYGNKAVIRFLVSEANNAQSIFFFSIRVPLS
jgi:hypothetical protein